MIVPVSEVWLGKATFSVEPDSVIFISAGTAHGTANTGDRPLRLHAVFRRRSSTGRCSSETRRPERRSDAPSHRVYDARTGEVRVLE
jgi:oxalate decarboxylase/phosphoglucose isomerase-like protein (cupin superfamily)